MVRQLGDDSFKPISSLNYLKNVGNTTINIDLQELTEDSTYHFEYEATLPGSNKKFKKASGQFKTFKNLQNEFKFVASSCSRSQSESSVFSQIDKKDPNFIINLGDLHYSARNRSKKNDFILSYHEIFKSPVQRSLYQKYPLIYTFDDHDFGSNNADALSGSGEFANQAYRDIIPSYELANNGVYQKFKVGKVQFLLIDARTFKNTFYENSTTQTNLGIDQLNWLKDSITEAANDQETEGVVLLLAFPWYSKREWNETTTFHEKLEIANLIEDLGFNTPKLKNKFLVMISGDTHMLSYDSGPRNQYGHFPIFQCSPLDSKPSCKQGGYGGDIYLSRGQYCVFDVTKHQSDSSRSCLNFQGFVQDKQVMDFNTCNDLHIKETQDFIEYYHQLSLNETISQQDRDYGWVRYDMLISGSWCPVTPKVKLQALFALFGLFMFILTSYNVIRNICYVRVE
eukprot:403333931